jgi:phosphoribosylaminoimidazole-succinocarboxamide synthase
MIVKKVKRLPVECVVRGYLAGSAWAEYQKSGTAFGIPLPKNMLESQELPAPLFTPTTKADSGHDMPMTVEEMGALIGIELANNIKEKSLAIYNFARKQAITKGIIIADTKFEFGLEGDKLIVIDEMLTPDSSRFWDAKSYKPGQSQPSYDKQPVRDWLTNSGWNKEPPAPMLPPEVIESTTRIYLTAFERLTGKKLS